MQKTIASQQRLSPWQVILPISLGTGLSLLGDTSLYTVLATHVEEVGILVVSVGILLSVNRWVRLPLNGPVGYLIERWPRKPTFVAALFLGALSTYIYALTTGFWPLFAGRLLWGIAWVGIWIGGNTMVMDISQDGDRGRWVGVYQISFFAGAGGGALLGGLLTDWVGFHNAMMVNASLTLLGALIALLALPETRPLLSKSDTRPEARRPPLPTRATTPLRRVSTTRGELTSASALFAVNRLAMAGFFSATFGLFLQQTLGAEFVMLGQPVGVATLTGLGLGLNTLISLLVTPAIGGLSDRARTRWIVAAGGLLPGALGFLLVTSGAPLLIMGGLILISITSGSNMNLSTALVGDLGAQSRQGRRLGWLFTVGDLASAIGPPLAFWMLPLVGFRGVYWFAAGLFGLMSAVAGWWGKRAGQRGGIGTEH